MKAYIELNNNIVCAYATYNVNGEFIEVEQEDSIIDFNKLQGYYIVFEDEVNKLKFDEERYNQYIDNIIEQQDIKKAQELQTQLLQSIVLNNATDEQAYFMKSLYQLWSGDSVEYKKYEKVQYNNKLYKVIQAHTSQSNWTPDTQKSLFVEISPPEVEYPEWRQPTMAEDAYNIGDKVTYKRKKYISIINANVWSPDDYAAGWKLIEESTTEPTDPIEPEEPIVNEYPDFKQPTGAHDAYNTGDKVTFNGKHYICKINACVWSPEAYPAGWDLVE